jgi:hypothetical protein
MKIGRLLILLEKKTLLGLSMMLAFNYTERLPVWCQVLHVECETGVKTETSCELGRDIAINDISSTILSVQGSRELLIAATLFGRVTCMYTGIKAGRGDCYSSWTMRREAHLCQYSATERKHLSSVGALKIICKFAICEGNFSSLEM